MKLVSVPQRRTDRDFDHQMTTQGDRFLDGLHTSILEERLAGSPRVVCLAPGMKPTFYWNYCTDFCILRVHPRKKNNTSLFLTCISTCVRSFVRASWKPRPEAIVAHAVETSAPCTTPPKITPDANASTIDRKSRQNVFATTLRGNNGFARNQRQGAGIVPWLLLYVGYASSDFCAAHLFSSWKKRLP